MNFTAGADISVSGLVSSSGLGPYLGVGAPASDPARGEGGTYGGSGGRVHCNNTFYSATSEQVSQPAMQHVS